MKSIWIIADESMRRVGSTRTIQAFALVFTVMALALSFFGLAGQRTAGFQGFARVSASLMNLVVYVVPMMALMVGTTEITGRPRNLAFNLAQPVTRASVLIGSYLGVAGALCASLLIGLGGAGLIIAGRAGSEAAGGYLVLLLASIGLLLVFLSLAFLIGVVLLDRLRSMIAAFVVWFLAVIGYDLFVIGISSLLKGLALKTILLPAILANPLDIVRVLVTLASGRGALFGPAGAVLVDVFGRPAGAAVAVAVVLLQIILPLVVAVVVFRRRDL